MNPQRRGTAALVLAALIATPTFAQNDGVPQKLPSVRLNIGIHNIQAEVARKPGERTIGLMFRTSMASHEGMLFEFEEPSQQCFWMKNTLIPLSVAFVADDGRIVNIESMKPQKLDSHCSTQPVRYVLEMNDGWFAQRGIKPGARVSGGPFKR